MTRLLPVLVLPVVVLPVLAMILMIGSALPAAAAKVASVVVDIDTGRTLQATDADTVRYPASLTKMMTLYMLFDALKRGKLRPSSRMLVSRRAAAMPPSKLGLRPGEKIRVADAILALSTKSANDVAVVVGEALGGSESRFATQMTKKARALGLRRTTFRNASGLHHPQQRTTARDMAMLGRALLRDHPTYYRYFATRTFVYRSARFQNHNRMLGVYRGIDGIKTGYTRAAGYNLVASAKRGDTRLIGVVMGAQSSGVRNMLMTRLLDDGFSKAPVLARRGGKKRRRNVVRAIVWATPPARPPGLRRYAGDRSKEATLAPPRARPPAPSGRSG